MSEDRTQAPSKRRRDEARAQGVVARSPELTAAVGLLAAVLLLGAWGGPLASGMLDLIRAPLGVMPEPGAAVATIRAAAFRVLVPLGGLLGGVIAAMVAAHQAQVAGLWAPGLLAPDPARLWSPGGSGWGARAARGGWGIVKAVVVVAVASWAIRSEFSALLRLGQETAGGLGRAAGGLLKGLAGKLALATLALGILDYLMARGRVEVQLRMTPDQHREDQKAVDGDPAVRSRRLRLAKSWRNDPSDALISAAVVVTGPAGLAVVLGGEGPPGKVTVRGLARGASGAILRRSAERAGLAVVAEPELARHFAGASARTGPLPGALARQLEALWPAPSERLPLRPEGAGLAAPPDIAGRSPK